ncbi:TolC family protein [Chitinophaga skermanii]|uniref:TolC family protein n=1 Tax=Chitinophaga skermanii TaxID=331697 RepID=UPI001B86FF8F|nr:TolC family protein [Chitinophaga skermanii]
MQKYVISTLSGLMLYIFSYNQTLAQSNSPILTIDAALERGQDVSKHISAAKIQSNIAGTKADDAKNLRIPDIEAHTGYARLTDLIQYDRGLKDPETFQSIYDKVDFTMKAGVPVYAGGKISHIIKKTKQELELAQLNTNKTARNVRLEIKGLYLTIFKMMEMQRLIRENIKEEEARLKEVQALKKNGVVTRNEILRAELQLSEQQLNLTAATNNVAIAKHQLQVLLELEDDFNIDTNQLIHEPFATTSFEANLHMALQMQDDLKMQAQEVKIKETDKRIAKAAYYPTVGLFGSYGLNYPNYFFFPPANNWYRLGMAGVDISFNISNLYKNRKKVSIAEQAINLQEVEMDAVKEAVENRVHQASVKYNEYIQRIDITRLAIAQAAENYRIVKNKYLNQLALITEMIDADNSLLEAKFNASAARIDTQIKFYELQYAIGVL